MTKRLKTKDINPTKIRILEEQGFKCAVCQMDLSEVESKNICLDHDHQTGYIRGVLCRWCNRNEGKIKNLMTVSKRHRTAMEWLRSLVDYYDLHADYPSNILHPKHKTPEEKREEKNRKARLSRAKAKALKNIKGRR